MSLKSATKKENNRVELVIEVDAATFEAAVEAAYRKDIQNISVMVTAAVDNLATNAEKLMNFIIHNVVTDYDFFVEMVSQYQEDAENMNSILSEFNAESSSISETMVQMNTGIRDISTTIEESARAVSDIAAEANSLATSIKAIQVDSEKNQGISDELLAEVQRFDKL